MQKLVASKTQGQKSELQLALRKLGFHLAR